MNKYNIQFHGLDNLQLLFIYLKLTKQIPWSWWWVMSPLWAGALILIALGVFVIILKWGIGR